MTTRTVKRAERNYYWYTFTWTVHSTLISYMVVATTSEQHAVRHTGFKHWTISVDEAALMGSLAFLLAKYDASMGTY